MFIFLNQWNNIRVFGVSDNDLAFSSENHMGYCFADTNRIYSFCFGINKEEDVYHTWCRWRKWR